MPNGNHLIGQKISYYLLAHFRFFRLDLPEIATRFPGRYGELLAGGPPERPCAPAGTRAREIAGRSSFG
ncbi:MAG: hypothetical protein ACYDHX_05655 [Methanothrix sp.]